MWSTSDFAQDTLEIVERRTRARTVLSPPIYVNLDNATGGLIFNMTEEGLGLTAARTLGGDGPLGLRICLPDPEGWIEATGQMVWRSEAGKTVGIRIIGLPEDARQRIRRWLAEETSGDKPHSEDAQLSDRGQHPSDSVLRETPTASFQALLDSNTLAERRMLEAILSEDSFASRDLPAMVLADAPHQLTEVAADNRNYGDGSPQLPERRVHRRCQIRPCSYVELGQDNGGMLLNIGEGGFAIATAECVTSDGFPSIRIQFTGSMDLIDVSGQVAWISESKREVGIRFVNLKEEARRIIAARISREEWPVDLPVQSVKVPSGPVFQSEFPELDNRDAGSENGVEEHLWALDPSPLAMPSMRDNMAVPAVAAPDALAAKFRKRSKFKPQSRPAIRPRTREEAAVRLRRIAATVVLVGVTGGAAGWAVMSPAIRNAVNGFHGENTQGTTGQAELQKTRPLNKITDVSALQSKNSGSRTPGFEVAPTGPRANGSETREAHVRPQMPSSERSVARPATNGAGGRIVSPPPKSPSPSLPQHEVVAVTNSAPESTGREAAVNSSAQSAGTITIPSASPSPNLKVDTTSAVVKEKESPTPPVKQPDVPVGATWSVAVGTAPYPSIRIPSDISSQKASAGRSLQIGHAISPVEPVYPEEAKHQGIEGTVKLHVVVGRDGSVQSVESMGGPDLLVKAATSVVRDWHYSQTLLGGQPVETEQDIVIKFRLVSPSMSRN
jgi:TonB family protein